MFKVKGKYDDSLNIERERIIMKIYLTLTDVRNFLRCSWPKAKIRFNEAADLCIKDGKKNLEGRVYYKYFLQVIAISESEIHKMAKYERQIKMSHPTTNDDATKL
ncbi:hypothetical protein [Clostridium phage Maintenon]|nr:hypothetical protein [[Clostridium] innocuum]WAK79431.1 hypothetical protein [Clostridium phage Maintenon]